MTVTVNGQPKEIADGTSLGRLLEQLQLRPDCVAVELNLNVIERDLFAATQLSAGDSLEIVQFVGGG